jgi:hypothetical protein
MSAFVRGHPQPASAAASQRRRVAQGRPGGGRRSRPAAPRAHGSRDRRDPQLGGTASRRGRTLQPEDHLPPARRTYGLEDRYARLRRHGLFTLTEISELLGASSSTVKAWALPGHIPSHVYNDKGRRLFELPPALQPSCRWCGDPVPAKPAFRRGKKWCSQRCCLAAYNSRKRATPPQVTPST